MANEDKTKPEHQPPHKGDDAAKKGDENLKTGAELDTKAEKTETVTKAKGEKRRTFYVVGPGSVMHGGKQYVASAKLQLTDEEALSLGESVAEGAPPPPPEEIENRKGGRYVVAGPGAVWIDGKPREKGFVLELDATEARKLGAAVAPAK